MSGGNFAAPLALVRDHIDMNSIKFVMDEQVQVIQAELILGSMNEAGEFTGVERIILTWRDDDFKRMRDHLLPNDDKEKNPRELFKKRLLKQAKLHLEKQHDLPTDSL